MENRKCLQITPEQLTRLLNIDGKITFVRFQPYTDLIEVFFNSNNRVRECPSGDTVMIETFESID